MPIHPTRLAARACPARFFARTQTSQNEPKLSPNLPSSPVRLQSATQSNTPLFLFLRGFAPSRSLLPSLFIKTNPNPDIPSHPQNLCSAKYQSVQNEPKPAKMACAFWCQTVHFPTPPHPFTHSPIHPVIPLPLALLAFWRSWRKISHSSANHQSIKTNPSFT
jgi:hypothetical protein